MKCPHKFVKSIDTGHCPMTMLNQIGRTADNVADRIAMIASTAGADIGFATTT